MKSWNSTDSANIAFRDDIWLLFECWATMRVIYTSDLGRPYFSLDAYLVSTGTLGCLPDTGLRRATHVEKNMQDRGGTLRLKYMASKSPKSARMTMTRFFAEHEEVVHLDFMRGNNKRRRRVEKEPFSFNPLRRAVQ